MKKDIVQTGQSIVDLAIQKYGSADGIFALLADNPSLVANWHDDPDPGTSVYVKSPPVNVVVHQYYANNTISPATLPKPSGGNALDYTLEFTL